MIHQKPVLDYNSYRELCKTDAICFDKGELKILLQYCLWSPEVHVILSTSQSFYRIKAVMDSKSVKKFSLGTIMSTLKCSIRFFKIARPRGKPYRCSRQKENITLSLTHLSI